MLQVIRFMCEQYASKHLGSTGRLVTHKVGQLIAIGMGQVLRSRTTRLRVLKALFGEDHLTSSLDLLEADGVPLLRWLYDLGEDGEFPADLKVSEEKARQLREYASSLWVGEVVVASPEEVLA